ncbi:MAG: glycosyltransferase family 4 protein [Alphaproteobacteria bacterium]|nr:glycosyltransferase family 4 protein [Alphaproteobacteria bacterium]
MIKQFVRYAWRLQPRFLRKFELFLLEKILIKPIDLQRQTSRGDILVCGFLGTASGLGENARHILRQFQEFGFDAKPANFSRFAALSDFENNPSWPATVSDGGVAVMCVNPGLFHLAFWALKRERLIDRRIIGVWYWELEEFSTEWKRALECVDEVWVGSQFTANAFRKIAGNKPVFVVHPPMDVASFPSEPRQDPLPQFKDRTVVFFMYDVRSAHARKNPEAVIKAFQRATQNDPGPVLVIKVNNGDSWPETYERLSRAIDGSPNIHIMSERLSADGMKDLLARVDIVMSLHRSEGFGLLMAEAMAAGKPVIATGWSGNLDFMTPDCSILIDCKLVPVEDPQHAYDRYGAKWAEPDVEQAARALRRLLDDPAERRHIGQAARTHILTYLSKDKWLEDLPKSFWDSLDKKPEKSFLQKIAS